MQIVTSSPQFVGTSHVVSEFWRDLTYVFFFFTCPMKVENKSQKWNQEQIAKMKRRHEDAELKAPVLLWKRSCGSWPWSFSSKIWSEKLVVLLCLWLKCHDLFEDFCTVQSFLVEKSLIATFSIRWHPPIPPWGCTELDGTWMDAQEVDQMCSR